MVRATRHVSALHTKTNAVRAMRLVTGWLAAGKIERNNAQAAVENVTIELPVIEMASRDADVHQSLTERIARYIQSIPITRRMASRINSRSMPSLSARNVPMRSTTGPQLETKHSLCSMSNHLDSREPDIHFG